MKVLIVDDSRAMRRLHREVLSTLAEVDVVEVEDGIEAIYALRAHDFKIDLILVDWMMPRMDGLTLVKHLKSTANLSRIPILMVTSCSDERRMREAWRAGVDGYLLKPFTTELFLHALVSLSPKGIEDEPEKPGHLDNEGQSFLDELPSEMRRRILDMSVVVDFKAGQAILYKGEKAEYFYFVVRGKVEEHQDALACNGNIVHNYRQGECFAVTELMAGDPLRSSFRSSEKSTIGRVPKAAFEGMLVKFPQISVTLSRYLATKARQLDVNANAEDLSSALSGRLEILDLPALVQAINLRQKTCEIVLHEIDASIVFINGQVIAVRHEEHDGTEAFLQIMEKKPRNFRILGKPRQMDRNVHMSTTLLLLETAQRLDEAEAARA